MDPSYYTKTQVARILMEVEIGALGDGCLSLIKHIFVGIPHTTSGKKNWRQGSLVKECLK